MVPWAIDPSIISQAGFAWADLQRQLEEAAKTEEQRQKERRNVRNSTMNVLNDVMRKDRQIRKY